MANTVGMNCTSAVAAVVTVSGDLVAGACRAGLAIEQASVRCLR
jgi:hypothetical protein